MAYELRPPGHNVLPAIIDTDPALGSLGIGAEDPEDGFAIMLALRSPELNVKAITVVHGNVPLANGYSNALHLVKLMGRSDIPVAPGLAGPLLAGAVPVEPSDARPHGRQLAPTADPDLAAVHGVDLIIDTVMNAVDPVTLIAIGPLSNIATALLREPRVARRAERLVIMGGALRVPGNVNPSAEFNVWADPHAAAVVFRSGMPITVVALDVCHQTLILQSQIESLDSESPLAQYVREATLPWFDARRAGGKEGFHLYDSLAVAVAFRPDLVYSEPTWIDVETCGRHTMGQTVAYLDPQFKAWFGDKTNCEACLQLVDVKGFAKLFDERVLAPLRR